MTSGVFSLTDALLRATERDGGAPAVRTASECRTYDEMCRAAGQVAAALLELGVGPGDTVSVMAEKSPAVVAALYGIMGVGAAYVPIDPQSPPVRAAAIVADARSRVLCIDKQRWQRLRGAAGLPDDLRVVALDAGVEGASVTDRDLATLDPAPLDRPCESDLAYILYTSGSTGVPKGVMLTHRNALAFAEWVVWRFGVTSHDRLVSHAPFHFDLSVFDLYGAVLSAACVRLLDAGERTFGKEMTDVVRADGLSVWYSVPSALTLLCDAASPADVETLRVVLFAGEVFPTKHLRRLRELLPRATLANLYGPTETNVCTYYVVPDRLESDDPIPIGRACENQDVFALDEDRRPVGVGGTGELWVRGPTVMKGYFGDAEKTRATLMQNPLHERFADPVYRTGDLVSPLADGDLAFLGRRDHQIKVRGYRVELGEIEAAMMSHPTVRECAVVAVPDERSGHRLVAFVVVEGELAERALRHHCAERIPKYMMPSELRVDASLPRTSTGKIDRQQLVERVQALLTSNE